MQTFYFCTLGEESPTEAEPVLMFDTKESALSDAEEWVDHAQPVTVWEVTGRPISKVRLDGIVEEAL